MFAAYNEELLRTLATRGEMPIRDFLLQVKRLRNDHTDFYGVAAMLHGGYMSTDTTSESGGEKMRGTLGIDTQSTAVALCQIALEPGQSFTQNDCPRESWHDFTANIFITIQGLLKLEALDENNSNRRKKRFDYFFAVLIAVFAAVSSGLATSYFSSPSPCSPLVQKPQ